MYFSFILATTSSHIDCASALKSMTRSNVTFDLVIDFKADAQSICDEVVARMKEKYKDYTFLAVLDSDYSD